MGRNRGTTSLRSWKIAALIAVHCHPLRVAAHFPVSGRGDWSAAVALGAALLEGQELLGAEGLIVDLRRGLDEILQVGAEEEVAEIDEFAVVLVLDVDDAPPILSATNLLAINNDGLLRAYDSEGDEVLQQNWSAHRPDFLEEGNACLDLRVDNSLLLVELVVVIGIHLEAVEGKLLLNTLLEGLSLLQG